MTLTQHIRQGLHLIRDSFIVLWNYKFLVAYPIIGMLLFAIVQLLVAAAYGMWTFSFLPDQKLVLYLINSSSYLVMLLLFFAQSFIVTFFAVPLAHHTGRLIHRAQTSIPQQIMENKQKISMITLWSLILVLVTLTQYSIAAHYQKLLQDSALKAWAFNSLQILLLGWILFTCYVIPIIGLEQISLIRAIKRSMRLVKLSWIEIITGFTVLLALTGIAIVPAVVWFTTMSIGSILITFLLVWPVQCIGSAITIIFTTVAYHHFYKQPMEDVEMLQYPQF